MAYQFNDTTNKTGLIQRCESLTGLGDGAISGSPTLLAQFTAKINTAVHETIAMIFDSQDEWDWDDTGTADGSSPTQTTYPVATTPLVAGQRDYVFPASLKILKIKRVDVSYDGVNFYRCNPFDSGEAAFGLGNDTTVDGRFVRTAPRYDIKANAIWLYPEANTGDAIGTGAMLRIEFSREFSEFVSTDTTKTLGSDMPVARIVPVKAALEYAIDQDLARQNSLQAQADRLEATLRNYYGRKDEDRLPQMKAGYINYN